MAESVKVKYFDPSGKSQEGYIIDNKTYKDSQGKERVDLGSVVETAGGRYMLTQNGGVKLDGENRYFQNAVNSLTGAKNSARQAISSSLDKQKRQIQNNKASLKKQYEALEKELNSKKKLSEKTISQILESQGIRGGMSESSIIANNVNYENSINELKEELEDKLLQYDNELLKLQSDADYNIFMSDAKYDTLYSQYLQDVADNQEKELSEERKLNSQNFINNRNYEQEKEEFLYKTESDLRDYLRRVYEDDRDYEWDKYNDNRNYELKLKKLK